MAVTISEKNREVNLFNKIDVTSISGIRVFYVGQGDSIGILNEERKVVLYVDYGGLLGHPDKVNGYSKIAEMLPPIAYNESVSVVLTHWDKDHYYSAKYVDQIQQGQWIVPDQRVGVQATIFSAKLSNVRKWRESIGDQPLEFRTRSGDIIAIQKLGKRPGNAQTEDRNMTGLGVWIIKNNSANKRQFILLPGDAPYHRIKGIKHIGENVEYIGGTAYHHGAKSHWTKNTVELLEGAGTNAKLIFSYSPENHYGHPNIGHYGDWKGELVFTPCFKEDGYVDILFD